MAQPASFGPTREEVAALPVKIGQRDATGAALLGAADRNIEEGKTVPISVAMRRLRARLRQLRKRKR
jgi:hypothetical protein